MSDRVLRDISDDDVRLMLRMGVPRAHISKIFQKCGLPLPAGLLAPCMYTISTLTNKEIEILRAGGARGLEDTPETRTSLLNSLNRLLEDCRSLLEDSYDISTVSSLLGISESEIEHKALQQPPALRSIESENGLLRFPRWQFTDSGTIPHLTALLAEVSPSLAEIHLNYFMQRPQEWLEVDGECLSPYEWLCRGFDPNAVLDLHK